MARIAGVNIPQEKRIEISLTYIYGIGKNTANKILKETKLIRHKSKRFIRRRFK